MSGGGGPKAGAPGGEVLYYVTLVHAARLTCQHVVNVDVFFFSCFVALFDLVQSQFSNQFFYLNKDRLILQVQV